MAWSNVHLIPLAGVLILPLTFITTYLLSVNFHDVEPEFPYISDTGTSSPESCIFSQLLNIVACLFLFSIYLRYKQIEQYYREHLLSEGSKILCRNRWALAVGTMACLGLSVVANFQETNLLVVHIVGAFLCFGGGLLYCWLQTWISFATCPLVNTRGVARWRCFLCIIMTICFIAELVATPLAFKYYRGNNPRKWRKEDGGFWLHIGSAVAEWILAIGLDLFIATFIREMRRISITSPKVLFIVENVNVSATNCPCIADDDGPFYYESISESTDASFGSRDREGRTNSTEIPIH